MSAFAAYEEFEATNEPYVPEEPQKLPKETKGRVYLAIRSLQVLLVLAILILESIQANVYIKYLRGTVIVTVSDGIPQGPAKPYHSNPTNVYFTDKNFGKGSAVIWVFLVVLITFLSLIIYMGLFKKIWEQRSNPAFVGFDAVFIILWVTEVFTNLCWAYKGNNSPCHSIDGIKKRIVCNSYAVSNVFGWLVLITFVLAAVFSWKAYRQGSKDEDIVEFSDGVNNRVVSGMSDINQQPLYQQQIPQSLEKPYNQQPYTQQPPYQQQFYQQQQQPQSQPYSPQPPQSQLSTPVYSLQPPQSQLSTPVYSQQPPQSQLSTPVPSQLPQQPQLSVPQPPMQPQQYQQEYLPQLYQQQLPQLPMQPQSQLMHPPMQPQP